MTELTVKTSGGGYAVRLGRGAVRTVGDVIPQGGKKIVVTDDGVPDALVGAVRDALGAEVFVFPAGERSKNTDTLLKLLSFLAKEGVGRSDAIVAVGGGVVSDLAGFAAAVYMRGIAYYTIPTTLLAMIDASIGGKCGVDFAGAKNVLGSFYPPRAVIADPDTLATLPERQMRAGFAEAVKIGVTLDPLVFALLGDGMPEGEALDLVIERCVKAKIAVVEKDEFDKGDRAVLNFGHTLGHALEAAAGGKYLHGECVAVGMLPMCSDAVRGDLEKVLAGLGLPLSLPDVPLDGALGKIALDKKKSGGVTKIVFVEEIGKPAVLAIPTETLKTMIRQRTEENQ